MRAYASRLEHVSDITRIGEKLPTGKINYSQHVSCLNDCNVQGIVFRERLFEYLVPCGPRVCVNHVLLLTVKEGVLREACCHGQDGFEKIRWYLAVLKLSSEKLLFEIAIRLAVAISKVCIR